MHRQLSTEISFQIISKMNVEQVREHCLSLKAVTEDMPFGDDTIVFRVYQKIFALVSLSGNNMVNLKCDPARAIELREEYAAIIPGYHMNKAHWNSVHLDGNLKDELIKELVEHSYQLIVLSLPKNKQEELKRIKTK